MRIVPTDQQNMQPQAGELCDQSVLSFGKHRGRTFLDVATTVPDYCRWILKASCSAGPQCGGFLAFLQYLQQRPEFAQHSAGCSIQSSPVHRPPGPPTTSSALQMQPPSLANGVHPSWPPRSSPATPMRPLLCSANSWSAPGGASSAPGSHPATPMRPLLSSANSWSAPGGTSSAPGGHPAAPMRPLLSSANKSWFGSSIPTFVPLACDEQPEPKRQKTQHATQLPTLGKSNFLKLYSAAPQRPSARDCMNALGTAPDLEDVVSSLSSLPIADTQALDMYVVKLWAKFKGRDTKEGTDFYKLLNRAIIADDPDRLRLMIPIARVLNKILVSYFPPSDVITWRGSQMTKDQLAKVVVGERYRVAMFLASSLDFEVAELFVRLQPGSVIVQLCIPRECHNAGYLGVEMFSEQEREYLMPPYTALTVTNKTHYKGYILLVVSVYKDNKDAPLDLPSILL